MPIVRSPRRQGRPGQHRWDCQGKGASALERSFALLLAGLVLAFLAALFIARRTGRSDSGLSEIAQEGGECGAVCGLNTSSSAWRCRRKAARIDADLAPAVLAVMFDPAQSGRYVEGWMREAVRAGASRGLEITVAQVQSTADIDSAPAWVAGRAVACWSCRTALRLDIAN
jgi:hypothetical protein